MSQLTQWYRCSWQYRLQRIDQASELPAAWTHQGSAFHEAIEAWELSGRAITIGEAQAVFQAAYDGLIDRSTQDWPDLGDWMRGGRLKTETDIDNRREAGTEQVAAYILHASSEGLTPIQIDGKPAIELKVAIDAGDFDVIGYIDAVLADHDDNLLIRDLKTGKQPSDPIQLRTYGYALEETWGLTAWWGDYYLAKEGRTSNPVDLTCGTKGTLVRWFSIMDEQERAGHYVPDFSQSACFSCGVKRSCSYFS